MNTQHLLGACLMALCLVATPGYAGDDDDDDDYNPGRGWKKQKHGHSRHHSHTEVVYAPVIHVRPIVRVVRVSRPRRECWEERRSTVSYSSGRDSATGVLLGGVLGGVIGHDLGRGHHQDAAIVAGTLLGASIGHDLSHQGRERVYETETERRCHKVNDYDEEEEVVGYRVKYRYYNRTYITETDRHPGSRIRVTVNVDD